MKNKSLEIVTKEDLERMLLKENKTLKSIGKEYNCCPLRLRCTAAMCKIAFCCSTTIVVLVEYLTDNDEAAKKSFYLSKAPTIQQI